MKSIYRSLAAGLVGAAIVVGAMWLSESVVAQVLFLPLEAGSLVILLALLVGGAVLVRRGRILDAAALSAGAGAAWALREVHPLSLCQSDMLYRPCTTSEVAWMALPAVGLLIAGSILLLSALPRRLHGSGLLEGHLPTECIFGPSAAADADVVGQAARSVDGVGIASCENGLDRYCADCDADHYHDGADHQAPTPQHGLPPLQRPVPSYEIVPPMSSRARE